MFFSKNIDTILRQQSEILSLQSQMSSGVRVNKSSDDPFAKNAFLSSQEALTMTNQYQRNIDYAQGRGQIIDTTMGSLTELMANVKERILQASTATVTSADRKNIAQELRVNLQQMLNLANVRDETGRYVFSGIKDDTPAFSSEGEPLSTNPADVVEFYKFTGDENVTDVQISREIKLSVDLSASEILTLKDGTPATSYFALLQQSINILEGNAPGTARGVLNDQAVKMDQVYDQMLIGRTRIGAKMRQVEETQLSNSSLSTEFEINGGRAVGVDFTKAVSDISRLQLSLEASQKSFSQFAKLSIFNFL